MFPSWCSASPKLALDFHGVVQSASFIRTCASVRHVLPAERRAAAAGPAGEMAVQPVGLSKFASVCVAAGGDVNFVEQPSPVR